MALFQPLTLLDLVVYHKDNGNIQRISELKCLHPYKTIPIDFKKSTIAIFLTEILHRSLKEETKSIELFEFLLAALVTFDGMQIGYENFHLQFLLKLSRHLGFAPSSSHELLQLISLDLRAKFGDVHQRAFETMLAGELDTSPQIENSVRRDLLESILNFYQYNQENHAEIRSLGVLREVLD